MYKASQDKNLWSTTPLSVDFLVKPMQREILTSASEVPHQHLNRIHVKSSDSLYKRIKSRTLSPKASNDRMAVGAV